MGGPALNPTQSSRRYATHWQLTSLGYGATQGALPTPRLHSVGQRVALVRPQVTEWYVNAPTGLEQGFTLPVRPGANPTGAPLQLTLQVRGDLTPQLSGQGQGLTLHNARGQTILRYDHLRVWDAQGIPLPARLTMNGRDVQLLVEDRHAHYPLTIDPTFTQQAYLKAANTGVGDNFGSAVAVAGDTVVIGAPYEESNATSVDGDDSDNSAYGAGAAYVFVRSGTTWSQDAYLKAANTGAGDRFGYAVAVAGDTVVIGAPLEDSNTTGVGGDGSNNSASNAGAAYVFVRSGTTWSQHAYLKAANTGAEDYFGPAVAVAGDTVVIGATGEDSNATSVDGDDSDNSASNAGAAYVFVRSGTTWSQEAYLKAANTGAGDRFGPAVAVAGDTVVIGAPLEDSNATGVNGDGSNNSASNAGAAYIFVRSGTTWSQQAYLKAANTGAEDYFGPAVAVAGDTVVIGATGEDSNATSVDGDGSDNSASNAGAAYVFTVPAIPEIEVAGNGVSIASGATTPDAADHTAFGNVMVGGSAVTRTFTISNSGHADLSGVAVSLSGDSAFRVGSQPAGTISASSSSTFTVAFAPNAAGVVTATVSIANDDSDENPYTFVVGGAATAPPTQATITIVLDARPDLPTNLGFGGSLRGFILDDPAVDDGDAYTKTRTFTVVPGTYTVRRNNPDSWFTTAIACTPAANAAINLPQRRAAITVAEGDNITCTFTVERAVRIIAHAFNDLVRRNTHLGKRNAGDPWLNDWTMTVFTAPTATVASGVTAVSGSVSEVSFANLRPGSYTVCVTLPDNTWTPTTPAAVDDAYGQPCKTVTLQPGQWAALLFGAYQSTVAASEAFTPEDELITDEDSIVDQPYDPAEDETATDEDGALRLFLPLVNR